MSDRYPGCVPYPGSTNHHGEIEKIGAVEVSHWFVSAVRSRYHLVTAGDPEAPVVVLLHGLPESWYGWHHQIADLARDRYVIAPDLKGYGQSEKRLDSVYSFAHCAFEMAVLLETLGVGSFDLVGHDRGAVLGDHLFNMPGGFSQRIRRYARLQQSFPRAHGEPRPPHAMMATNAGTEVFLSDAFPRMIYAQAAPPGLSQLTFNVIPEPILARIEAEWRHPGVAQAVTLCFVHTNFDIEMEDRANDLIPKMKCPVHLIQAELDPGQKPADYEGLEALGDHFSIEWIAGAGHFSHLEKPAATTAAIRRFLIEQSD
jgi:pimeloyl-ACP methyl ester carboxylesterase